jgi:hypothetical protein
MSAQKQLSFFPIAHPNFNLDLVDMVGNMNDIIKLRSKTMFYFRAKVHATNGKGEVFLSSL